jgi:hypothetical protein
VDLRISLNCSSVIPIISARDRNLLLADVVSWVSKPCRCLFHITPAIPNCHFIPSSLLFFIHNSQLALISGCFQPQVICNNFLCGCNQRLRRYQGRDGS